jgi:putative membrane protein
VHPDGRRPLYLRARAARVLDGARLRLHAQQLRAHRSPRAQGFIPAIIAREVLLRRTPLRSGGWLFFIVCSICLAVSACYEFIEWWAAVLGGSAATDFLGTQGHVWDTQWDMLMALVGSIVGQIILSRVHDRQLLKTPLPETRH